MRWLAEALRWFADRIDRAGAPKAMTLWFTFEQGRGLVINDKGVGCRFWYLGDSDYERAHADAGTGLPSPTSATVAR